MKRAVVVITVGFPLWGLAGYLGYAAADRVFPAFIYSITPVPHAVRVGGEFRLDYTLDRFRSCNTTVYRTLYTKAGQTGQRRHTLPDASFSDDALTIGRHLVSTRPINLPAKDGEEGPAIIEMRSCYVCNFTHYLFPICRPPWQVHFMIIGRD